MDYESLMKSMEASADEKKREIIEKARLEASAIVEDARMKAAEIEKAYQLRAMEAATRDRNRSLYLAKSEARREVAGIKHEMFDRAFTDAKTRLAGVRDNNGYRQRFKKLAEEAASALGGEKVVLEVDQRDEALCREAMPSNDHTYDIKPDLNVIGGLNASTPDGKVVVFNTVESRLGTARERLKREIFSTLFGD
jgi:V/A-type H+-transporting ATPase subunit E